MPYTTPRKRRISLEQSNPNPNKAARRNLSFGSIPLKEKREVDQPSVGLQDDSFNQSPAKINVANLSVSSPQQVDAAHNQAFQLSPFAENERLATTPSSQADDSFNELPAVREVSHLHEHNSFNNSPHIQKVANSFDASPVVQKVVGGVEQDSFAKAPEVRRFVVDNSFDNTPDMQKLDGSFEKSPQVQNVVDSFDAAPAVVANENARRFDENGLPLITIEHELFQNREHFRIILRNLIELNSPKNHPSFVWNSQGEYVQQFHSLNVIENNFNERNNQINLLKDKLKSFKERFIRLEKRYRKQSVLTKEAGDIINEIEQCQANIEQAMIETQPVFEKYGEVISAAKKAQQQHRNNLSIEQAKIALHEINGTADADYQKAKELEREIKVIENGINPNDYLMPLLAKEEVEQKSALLKVVRINYERCKKEANTLSAIIAASVSLKTPREVELDEVAFEAGLAAVERQMSNQTNYSLLSLDEVQQLLKTATRNANLHYKNIQYYKDKVKFAGPSDVADYTVKLASEQMLHQDVLKKIVELKVVAQRKNAEKIKNVENSRNLEAINQLKILGNQLKALKGKVTALPSKPNLFASNLKNCLGLLLKPVVRNMKYMAHRFEENNTRLSILKETVAQAEQEVKQWDISFNIINADIQASHPHDAVMHEIDEVLAERQGVARGIARAKDQIKKLEQEAVELREKLVIITPSAQLTTKAEEVTKEKIKELTTELQVFLKAKEDELTTSGRGVLFFLGFYNARVTQDKLEAVKKAQIALNKAAKHFTSIEEFRAFVRGLLRTTELTQGRSLFSCFRDGSGTSDQLHALDDKAKQYSVDLSMLEQEASFLTPGVIPHPSGDPSAEFQPQRPAPR